MWFKKQVDKNCVSLIHFPKSITEQPLIGSISQLILSPEQMMSVDSI